MISRQAGDKSGQPSDGQFSGQQFSPNPPTQAKHFSPTNSSSHQARKKVWALFSADLLDVLHKRRGEHSQVIGRGRGATTAETQKALSPRNWANSSS